MKWFFLRLSVAALTFIIGAAAASFMIYDTASCVPAVRGPSSAPARHPAPPPLLSERSGPLSVCSLAPGAGDFYSRQVRVRGMIANFEMNNPKAFDLACPSDSVRVHCASGEAACRKIFADLKAAGAATVEMEMIGTYSHVWANPEDRQRGGPPPESRLRIDRVVEVGAVSFPFEADMPYPAIEGRRNQPKAKKKEKLPPDVYTVAGNADPTMGSASDKR